MILQDLTPSLPLYLSLWLLPDLPFNSSPSLRWVFLRPGKGFKGKIEPHGSIGLYLYVLLLHAVAAESHLYPIIPRREAGRVGRLSFSPQILQRKNREKSSLLSILLPFKNVMSSDSAEHIGLSLDMKCKPVVDSDSSLPNTF